MLIPKVLLVNDDPASLLALESLLTDAAVRRDYELVSAGSGEEALRQVLRHDFAVILLDAGMPGMDGFEVAEAIHAHPRCAAVPIIFITARYGDDMNRLRAYRSGAADYLFTPVVPQVLQAKVAVFVDLARKSLLLESKSAQLAQLNQDLRAQRLRDLERINAELQLEVAERKQAEQRAGELAIRDPLTGLLNRRALLEQLEHAVTLGERQQGEFALLFLDLDKFKDVNDGYGHDIGDELLRQVAARLTAAVRASDLVARLGGDEFVVLVEGRGAAANAARVARKIAQAHARPYQIERQRVTTSSSIGIALYPQDGAGAHLLLKHADLAMYHAKQHRGSVSFFHEAFNLRERERARWRQELRLALDAGQLELYYQPAVDIASGAVAAVEAQLHWRHPRLGLLAAPDWQDQVPDLALLERLDDWCIGAACAQAARWRAAGAAPRVAINVLSAQLQPELARKVGAAMRRHGLPAGAIGVELPEALLCGPPGSAAATLQQLHAAGVALSLDHFGSAGAALRLCNTLPLDQLKIDAGFVRAIGDAAGGSDMLGAVVLLARALGLASVALGVQTQAQLATLAELGCRAYQGELFSGPLSAAELRAKLPELARAELG
ncbi:putative bifunctional diguanylate cyclase/phosphodiesterase [Janthinobacterium sp.]|uniref:putative bifunctional diguanylate cyclase/phosphodiesterase n=1 Tax=Janthinobacterium sp. TaxID=1871054 RepID=UPI00293D6A9B|nr:EAL domain-containing protein [Janthinobacterium sp.]